MQIIECVPNISEGKDKEIINKIVEAVQKTGAKVLHVDIGYDANRTVITFAGDKDTAFRGAYALIKNSFQLIDMSTHKGEHPRLGCVDVCPFVPVKDVTMGECVEMAKNLAQKVTDTLELPVYLYANAAQNEERKNLAYIRKGEYPALAEKLKTLPPDYGPQEINEAAKKGGAITIGARDILIAFNISLNTKDADKAKLIAAALRESGTGRKLPAVKAIGWYMEEYNCAQISCNILNAKATPLHILYEAAKEEAAALGVEVTGSEIIGLCPESALVRAGKNYVKGTGKCFSKRDKIQGAIDNLNLNLHGTFDQEKRVIEYLLK
ncbi:glutamate formiminotransferase [Elusimicrobium posterum]|uniref:glutamate formimidoyltransferase n=1 Tax=Elusimicrobium posterum TaxID=3116653 RepID=UPI003C7577C6